MKARAVVLVAAISTMARASDVEGAEKLFKAGREALARGDGATACQRFRASLALAESEPTIVYVADCDARDGKLADAAAALRDVVDRLTREDAKDPLIPEAKKRLAVIEKRTPQLTVALASDAPEGTRVLRDGSELKPGALGVALPVNVGPHSVRVTAPGRKDVVREVPVAEGTTIRVEVAPGEVDDSTPTAGKPATFGSARKWEPPPRVATDNTTLGFALGGVGIVGLGVAVYEYIAITGRSTAGCTGHVCPTPADASEANDAASSAKSGRTLFYVGSLVGLGGLGAGAFLLLSKGSDPSVGLSITPRSAGISGRF